MARNRNNQQNKDNQLNVNKPSEGSKTPISTNENDVKLLEYIMKEVATFENNTNESQLTSLLQILHSRQLINRLYSNDNNSELQKRWLMYITSLLTKTDPTQQVAIFISCKLIAISIEQSDIIYLNGIVKWTGELNRCLQKVSLSDVVCIEVINTLSKLLLNTYNQLELQREVTNSNLPIFISGLMYKLKGESSEKVKLTCLKSIHDLILCFPKQYRSQVANLRSLLLTIWTDDNLNIQPNTLLATWWFKCLSVLCLSNNTSQLITENFNKELECLIDTANFLLNQVLITVQEPYKQINNQYEIEIKEDEVNNLLRHQKEFELFLLACQGIIGFLNFKTKENSLLLSIPIKKCLDLCTRIYSFGPNSRMLNNQSIKCYLKLMSNLPILHSVANDLLVKMCQRFSIGMVEHCKLINNIINKLFYNSIGYSQLRDNAYSLVCQLIYYLGDNLLYFIMEGLILNIISDLKFKQKQKMKSQVTSSNRRNKTQTISNSDQLLNNNNLLKPEDNYEWALKALSMILKHNSYIISYELKQQFDKIIYFNGIQFINNQLKLTNQQQYQLIQCLYYSSLIPNPSQASLLELTILLLNQFNLLKEGELKQFSTMALQSISLLMNPQLPASTKNVTNFNTNNENQLMNFSINIMDSNNTLLNGNNNNNDKENQDEKKEENRIDNSNEHSSIDIEIEKEEIVDEEVDVEVDNISPIVDLISMEKREAEEELENLENKRSNFKTTEKVQPNKEISEGDIIVENKLIIDTVILKNENKEEKVEEVIIKAHKEMNLNDDKDSDDESIPDIVF
ncbi:hypothetical protein K502DRAFT_323035 [Neoconidiobolus thromboides FSU 785]|nr:hypothetical protein K502DRAFT_323035 [Neoconidiobolus thromboides FSU 785]